MFLGFTYARNEYSALHNTKTAFLKGNLPYFLQILKSSFLQIIGIIC